MAPPPRPIYAFYSIFSSSLLLLLSLRWKESPFSFQGEPSNLGFTVQWLSHVRLFATPRTTPLSFTIFRSLLKFITGSKLGCLLEGSGHWRGRNGSWETTLAGICSVLCFIVGRCPPAFAEIASQRVAEDRKGATTECGSVASLDPFPFKSQTSRSYLSRGLRAEGMDSSNDPPTSQLLPQREEGLKVSLSLAEVSALSERAQ